MKKIFYTLLTVVLAGSFACSPQLDEFPDIGSAPVGDFAVDNSDPNNIILTVDATNAFLYTWDLGNGAKAEGDVVEVYYPFKGNYTITCTISGKGGAIISTKEVIVSATDPAIANKPGFKELTDAGIGRTWMYDFKDVGNDGEPDYLYMTANYDWEEFWWNPYSSDYGHPSPGFFDKMKFDLDGGYNYTFIEEDGTETKGTFLLDMTNMTLQIVDAEIPDQQEENCDPDMTATGLYQVKILSDNSLYLWQDQSFLNPDDFDYGWAWEFKPE